MINTYLKCPLEFKFQYIDGIEVEPNKYMALGTEVIFEEFKGTGNMEVYLDRLLSDKRIFPAIDINRSGTRKEELLLDEDVLSRVWVLRKVLGTMNAVDNIPFLIDKMKGTKNNKTFLDIMNK